MDHKRLVFLVILAGVLACGGEETRQSPSAMSAEERLRAALARPMSLERTAGIVAAFEDLDTRTAQQLAEIMDSPQERIPVYELKLLYATWAARDADAALDFILLRDSTAKTHMAIATQVVSTVASREAAKARTWVTSLTDVVPEDLRAALVVGLAEGWPASTQGYEGISELIQTLPRGFERDRSVRVLVRGLVRDGKLDDAMRWAESIPLDASKQYRALAFRKIAEIAGKESPMRVSDWLDGHREHRYGQAGIRILARSWAQRDPEGALVWAMAQPDDRARFLAVKFSYQAFYDAESAAAQTWLATQPDSAPLDVARMTFALSHSYADSREAAAEALKIKDEALRKDTLSKVLRHWFGNDAPAARAWMDTSGLPESYWNALRQAPAPPARRSAPNEDGAD
jgi:hypothetical protein